MLPYGENGYAFVCIRDDGILSHLKNQNRKKSTKIVKKLFTNGKRCAIIIPQKENLDFERGLLWIILIE